MLTAWMLWMAGEKKAAKTLSYQWATCHFATLACLDETLAGPRSPLSTCLKTLGAC